ncbi:MAG TPA: histidine ammonia-lyase, partial [Paraburkholderia sp.]
MAEHDLNDAEVGADPVVIGGRRLTIEDVVAVARHGAPVRLSDDPAWRARIARGAEFLRRHLEAGATVYG